MLIIALSLQLYERRKKSEKETKLWKSVDYNFTTEESDGGDDIRKHSLPWRSEGKVTNTIGSARKVREQSSHFSHALQAHTYQWCIERGHATAHRPM